MLRGEAMSEYFARYLSDEQAGYMREVLSMKAVPGSLPASAERLRMPLDGGRSSDKELCYGAVDSTSGDS